MCHLGKFIKEQLAVESREVQGGSVLDSHTLHSSRYVIIYNVFEACNMLEEAGQILDDLQASEH